MPSVSDAVAFMPVSATTGKPLQLAMQKLWLRGRILPIGARLMIRHVFRSSEDKPLEVVYSFALPRDAALRGFRVVGEGFSVRSQLKPTEEARKTYEKGVAGGHLSTLATQYGDGIINLVLGNIRPGETVAILLEALAGVEFHEEGIRFRFPFTLAPSYHHNARAIEVEPREGEMELPEEEFGDLILPRYQADASDLHEVGFALSVWIGQGLAEVGSPSHGVRVRMDGEQQSRVSLAVDREVPDRDLVLDVRTRHPLSAMLSGVGKDGKGRFAAVVPSERFGKTPAAARRVVFVLDRSGSMEGPPIKQARKALEACLSVLSGTDRFGLVAFDDRVESFRPVLAEADKGTLNKARTFLKNVHARGGTELTQAVLEAAKLLAGEGGDILLLTDGQVFGTENILGKARAAGVRIHCLGIGSARQDRFLALLARQTGGVSRFLTPRERVDLPSVDLFASIGRPVASRVRAHVEGIPGSGVAPEPPASVFAGTPLVVLGETDGGGKGSLVVEWETAGDSDKRDQVALPLEVSPDKLGETLRLLHGSRLITDLESEYTSESGAAARRQRKRLDERLRELSEAFGLASRAMSLVAVVERPGDKPGDLPKTVVVPVGMPQDVGFDAYFGGPAIAAAGSALGVMSDLLAEEDLEVPAPAAEDEAEVGPPSEPGPEDRLLELAGQLEPDGGRPGANDFERAVRTLVALLAFLSEGHTASSGAFRIHVQKLTQFLETSGFASLADKQSRTARSGLQWVQTGKQAPWNIWDLLDLPAAEAWTRIRELGQLAESSTAGQSS